MLRGHQPSNRDKQLAYTSSIILIIATTITIVIKTIIVVISNYTTFRQQCTIKSEYASFQLCEKASNMEPAFHLIIIIIATIIITIINIITITTITTAMIIVLIYNFAMGASRLVT